MAGEVEGARQRLHFFEFSCHQRRAPHAAPTAQGYGPKHNTWEPSAMFDGAALRLRRMHDA